MNYEQLKNEPINESDFLDWCSEKTGNWRGFDSFCWNSSDMDDSENWYIYYTHNRDSTLLDQSNSDIIEKMVEEFEESAPDAYQNDPDIQSESHSHWACGWIDGYSIRIYDSSGNPTLAARLFYIIQSRLNDYPILDEYHYSELEWEATNRNLEEIRRMLDIPEHLEVREEEIEQLELYDIVQEMEKIDHNCLESCDDQGAWPDESLMIQAIENLLE